MPQGNILLDDLPRAVNICGTEYAIDTDFRTAIRFTLLMQDGRIDEWAKIDIVLYMFFGDVRIPDVQQAIDALMWFYRCGKTEANAGHGGRRSKQVYDFDHDADLIYAAFLDQYGIDLQAISLHWWTFRALFIGLSEDTELMKVISYRSIEITNDMSSEQKKRYRKLKEMYSLPDKRTEEEKERDFALSLAGL